MSTMSVEMFKQLSLDWFQTVQSKGPMFKWLSIMGIGGCLLVLRIVYKKVEGKIYKYPPQMYGIPVFGSILTMLIWQHSWSTKIQPSYGDILRYNLGSLTMHKINNAQLCRPVFHKANAIDRPVSVCYIFIHCVYNI